MDDMLATLKLVKSYRFEIEVTEYSRIFDGCAVSFPLQGSSIVAVVDLYLPDTLCDGEQAVVVSKAFKVHSRFALQFLSRAQG
jgi:hypothetical protein